MDNDSPMSPVPFHGHDPAIQRRERSWTLIAGSHRLSFARIDHQIAPRPIVTIPARRWSLTGMIAIGLGSTVAMVTLGLALNASRAATGGGYVLRIPIPDVVPLKTRSPRPKVTVARPAALAPQPLNVAAPAVVTVSGGADETVPPEPAAVAVTAMQPAIAAALRTGTLQQWSSSDGAERGFVVAGPMEQGCRTLSILTRHDGGNDVRTQRECAGTAESTTTPAIP